MTYGTSFHRSPQLEKQLRPLDIIPDCKVSAGALGVVFHTCFPPTKFPNPEAAVWVLRLDIGSSYTHLVGYVASHQTFLLLLRVRMDISPLHLAADIPWNALAKGE